MFFSKNVLTIEKNQRMLSKLPVFPLKKYQERGGQSGKNPTIGGDLYDQGGSKNRGLHNGRKGMVGNLPSGLSWMRFHFSIVNIPFYDCFLFLRLGWT